jgi:hypothetical protein
VAAPALLLCALLTACSGKPPVISRVMARPILVHDISRDTFSERLSVFLVASDPDGQEDLSDFAVINDDAQLFWSVDNKTWLTAAAEGESWIGTNGLTMPDGAPFPEGTYRVLLSDVGGDTAEESFTLSAGRPAAANAAYPGVSIKEGTIRVSTALSNPEVWVYSRDARLVTRYPANGPPLDVEAIASANPVLGKSFSFWVFASDPKGAWGVASGPYASTH